MSIEQRLEQVERQTKRLRIAVVVLAAALCGVVSMAATERNNGVFDTVVAKAIYVQNAEGNLAAGMGSNDGGDGLVTIFSSTGKDLVALGATVAGAGIISTYGPTGKTLVELAATVDSEGAVSTYGPTGNVLVALGATVDSKGAVNTYNGSTGKTLVELGATPNGGFVGVNNKTGEGIITLKADDYGNGEVGAWNRKGKGRVWSSQ